LDLSQWPPIYLEATHFDTEHLHEFEEDLDDAHAILTYAIHEAEVILSRAVKKARIKFDLRAKGVYTEEIESRQSTTPSSSSGRKRKREGESDATHPISDLTAFGEGSTDVEGNIVDRTGPNHETDQLICDSKQRSGEDRRSDRMVRVLRTEWFADSKKLGKPQPLEKYITYQGRVVESPAGEKQPEAGGHKVLGHASGKDTATPKKSAIARPIPIGATCGSEILRRATADASAVPSKVDRFGSRKYHNPHVNTASWEAGRGTQPQHASLLQQTTTEYEDASSSEIPEAPDWVKQRLKYAVSIHDRTGRT
jgi:DNA polymerase IV